MRLFLIATADDGPIQVTGSQLGTMQLNGCCLVAYEIETTDKIKHFRFASSPPLSLEREAASIRYLAAESFLVSLWPEIKERIEGETRLGVPGVLDNPGLTFDRAWRAYACPLS
jgi:hypothetical protein